MIRNKKSKFNIFKFLSVLLIIIFVLFIPKVIQKLIIIKKIECISQFGECSESIINHQLTTNKSLLNTRIQITKRLEKNILVNSYLVQYKIPNTLKIEVNLKKPIYAIKGKENKFYVLDRNGLIIDTTESVNLITLVDESFSGILGQTVDDRKMFLLKIIEKVNWLYSINVGKMDTNYMLIVLNNNIKVLFPLEGDVDLLVGSLRLIFSRLNDSQEGITMSEIDLRFKEIVLR